MKALAFVLALALGADAVRAEVKISFQGNSGLGKRKLLDVINPEPAEYNKEGLQSWREDAEFYLLDLYRSYGYFDAAVRTDLSPRGKDPRDWEAVFVIQEGPRYVYDTVSVLGAHLRQAGEPHLPSTRDSAAGPTAVVPRTAPSCVSFVSPPLSPEIGFKKL